MIIDDESLANIRQQLNKTIETFYKYFCSKCNAAYFCYKIRLKKDLLQISPPIRLNEYLEYMGSPRGSWASGESGGISRLNVDKVNSLCDLVAERE